MIVRVPTGTRIEDEFEVTKQNAGDGFVQGVEGSLHYQFHPQWTFSGTLTWLDGEVDTFPTSAAIKRREPLDRLMPLTSYVGLRWDHPSGKYWVSGHVAFVEQQDNLSSRDQQDTQRIPPGGTPGYAVFSIRSGWQPMENLTDEDYRVHGSGQNEPGRNVILSLDMTF